MIPGKFTESPLTQQQIDQRLKEVVEAILKEASPLRIIVFGSSALGTAKPSSDLDIAVIFASVEERDRARKPLAALPARFGYDIDFLLFESKEYQQKLDRGGVCELIEREGRVLHKA